VRQWIVPGRRNPYSSYLVNPIIPAGLQIPAMSGIVAPWLFSMPPPVIILAALHGSKICPKDRRTQERACEADHPFVRAGRHLILGTEDVATLDFWLAIPGQRCEEHPTFPSRMLWMMSALASRGTDLGAFTGRDVRAG
jgi:hypothetical protein